MRKRTIRIGAIRVSPVNAHHRNSDGERGQTLIFAAVCMLVLLLFVALAVDFGVAYVTKARLNKASDAAALTAAKNLSQGDDTAAAIAKSSFTLNYQSLTNDPAPTPQVYYTCQSTDLTIHNLPCVANDTKLINVKVTATSHTFFAGLLPSYKTLAVSSYARVNRARVIMSLVLDRSSSMVGNGGAAVLPSDVSQFVNKFDDNSDSVAMVSFASVASPDVPMLSGSQTGKFKDAITTAASKMNFAGHTFSDGGLQKAKQQIDDKSKSVSGNVAKVVVFFTDGLANVIQDNLVCNGPAIHTPVGGALWNYGGYSVEDGGQGVGFMDPNTGAEPYHFTGKNDVCSSPGTFPAASNSGYQTAITQGNVEDEAKYRAIADANNMRSENIYVYSIGLGNDVNEDFLYQIANDPHSSTYDPTKPVGEADFAPTSADLQAVFQKIASRILVRLSR